MSVPFTLQVIPWNGYKGALSLTFDDGDPSQLDVAVPELAKRDFKGTFFLIQDRLVQVEDWKRAADAGQEIGNHSLTHKRAKDLVPGEAERQVLEAKNLLEDLFKMPLLTFAYPFTEINPALRRSAQTHHLLSRGGMGSYYLMPASFPDWDYLPSPVAYTLTSSGVYKGWADQAIAMGSWTIPQFHAFEGTLTGWQPLAAVTFVDFLDYLVERRNEIWIAPMGEVGAYWKAQKQLEEAKPEQVSTKTTWTWDKPPLFPHGLILKVQIKGKNIGISQKGKALQSLADSLYAVHFDEKELTVETF